MALKKIEGHATLMSGTRVSPAQMKLVEDLLSLYRAKADLDEETAARYQKGILQRKELKSGHKLLRGKLASPYFIVKNTSCQVKGQHGMYNLTVLKVDAGMEKAAAEKNAAEKAAADAKANGTEMPTKTTKKKVAKKKVAVAKKAGAGTDAPTTTTPKAPTKKKEARPKKEAKGKKEAAPADVLPEPAEPTTEPAMEELA